MMRFISTALVSFMLCAPYCARADDAPQEVPKTVAPVAPEAGAEAPKLLHNFMAIDPMRRKISSAGFTPPGQMLALPIRRNAAINSSVARTITPSKPDAKQAVEAHDLSSPLEVSPPIAAKPASSPQTMSDAQAKQILSIFATSN